MSDNLTPLFTKFWMHPESLRFSEERLAPEDVEYLRADIGKEREAKLIKAAYNQGAMDNNGERLYPLKGHEDALVPQLNKEIYMYAEIEELP